MTPRAAALVLATTLAAGAAETGMPSDPPRLLVGGYGPALVAVALDPASGALRETARSAVAGKPSFGAITADGRHVYAIDESSPGRVAALRFDRASGTLTRIGDAQTGGAGPCHCALLPSGRALAVAHYGSGSVSLLPVLADGGIGPASVTVKPGANSHMALPSPDGRFLLVPCKGADRVVVFAVGEGDAPTLTPHGELATAAGAGPRHLAFHPDGRHACFVNELDSTITACTWDAQAGRLAALQTLTLLPAGAPKNTAAHVAVHPSGRFVYASNRGHDSIAIFAVDAEGRLSAVDHETAGGRIATPRHFALSADGAWLLVASQKTDRLLALRVDPERGTLTPVGEPLATAAKPAWVGVLP